MLRRGIPVALAVTATLADVASAPRAAFYALVLAVPFAAVAALEAYGELLDAAERGAERRYEQVQAVLAAAVLALIVLGAAARVPAVGEGVAPTFASSALVACLVALLAQSLMAGAAQIRQPVHPPARETP